MHGAPHMPKENRPSRPLSPHLQVYRWPATMVTSITHRATGIALSAGALLLCVWILTAATGPVAYNAFRDIAGSWFGQVVLFGFSWALVFHLLNGVRHLYWDSGFGFENTFAERTRLLLILLSAVLTILIWVAA